MSCYKRQLRIRDNYTDFRWNSKTVTKAPYWWNNDDSKNEGQVLFREIENPKNDYSLFVEIIMYHYAGRRVRLLEEYRPTYGFIETDNSYTPELMVLPVGKFPNTVSLQVSPELDIHTVSGFIAQIKKQLHL